MSSMNVGGYQVVMLDKSGTEIKPMNVNYDLENMVVTVTTNVVLTGEKVPKDEKKGPKVVKLNFGKDTKPVVPIDDAMNKRTKALADKLAKEKGADDHEEKPKN